jgi:hypothetical protein
MHGSPAWRSGRLRLAGRLALALIWLVGRATGSEGDADAGFRSCWATCQHTGCAQLPGSDAKNCAVACPGNGYEVPPALRATQWDCRSDCAYACMWARERAKQQRSQHGEPDGAYRVVKYFGKWPFVRLLGMQEPASVLFSLANLGAHAHCLAQLLAAHAALGAAAGAGAGAGKASPPQRGGAAGAGAGAGQAGYPFLWVWVLYAGASMNAWVWSAVFHSRDTRATERLDYLVGADVLVAVSLYTTVVRVAGLTGAGRCGAVAGLLGCGLARHAYHMLAVKFDYGYNVGLCIALGLGQGVAWLAWVTRVRHPGRWRMYQFLGAVHVAMLLEVLDFPPLGWAVDAHAAWHAATAPLTYLWYGFVRADMAWLMQQPHAAAAAAAAGGSKRKI